jgi:hypothetical protein
MSVMGYSTKAFKIIFVAAFFWAFWVGTQDFGVWFTLTNEESARPISHMWFFLGPFVFLPCLLLSLPFRLTFGALLILSGIAFSLLSVIGRPFAFSLPQAIMQAVEIGIPMAAFGVFQLTRRGKVAPENDA